MKNWKVEVDGISHTVEYKKGFRNKVIIDGEVQKLKSSSSITNLIDYEICFGDTKCNLVVIGKEVDLAVNGVYLNKGTKYEPVSALPSWVLVLSAINILGGLLLTGVLGMCIGSLFSMLYIQASHKKKKGAVIMWFILSCILQVILAFGIVAMLS
ncbi:hypothetical protein [Clostridium weizhouense]|uniref:Uncharacterized protein n=1 Tax=Clostridium weizhouense TaxID=2859781 RepID=A0ABS7AMI0_9CLOT|nr:hypothetical protein [Clostridium weizhouense]MBW6409862.1 hypothetical protein [Clostridium weizhouense]